MAKTIEKQAASMPPLPANPHMDLARSQAAALFTELEAGKQHPAVPELPNRRPPGRMLLFVSFSIGDASLKAALASASRNQEVVLVFRGVKDPDHLATSVMEIQALARGYKPMPKVMLDPTLFQKHNVTQVPTLVYLDDTGEKNLSMVTGLTGTDYLTDKIAVNDLGNHGNRGPVVPIAERDLIEVMKEKVAGIDWAKKKEEAAKRYWTNQQFIILPAAELPSTRELDPTIVLTDDIRDATGAVITAKGTRINPLSMVPFNQAMVIFDATDDHQVALVKERLIALKKQFDRITLITTQFNRAHGWQSYTDITNTFDAPVFKLTPDVQSRWDIKAVPTVVTAKDTVFVLEELAAPPKKITATNVSTIPAIPVIREITEISKRDGA